jgi:hypothetical protein
MDGRTDRSLQKLRDLTSIMILTISFCNVNTFLLSAKLPQRDWPVILHISFVPLLIQMFNYRHLMISEDSHE